MFNAVGVVFKGSGFYRNDSRGASTSSEKAETKGDTKTDSTSDSKPGSTTGTDVREDVPEEVRGHHLEAGREVVDALLELTPVRPQVGPDPTPVESLPTGCWIRLASSG